MGCNLGLLKYLIYKAETVHNVEFKFQNGKKKKKKKLSPCRMRNISLIQIIQVPPVYE